MNYLYFNIHRIKQNSKSSEKPIILVDTKLIAGKMSSNETDPNRMYNLITSNFKTSVIKDVLKSQFTNNKTKISEEAVELVAELAKVLTVEAALRSAHNAKLENKQLVTLDHTESILPQMMLDFA